MSTIKELAIRRLYQVHDEYLGQVTGLAGNNEQKTYIFRLLAAEQVIAGNITPAAQAFFVKRAARRGISIQMFAQSIIDRANAMQSAIGYLDDCFDAAEDALLNTELVDSQQIDQIIFNFYDS